MGTRPVLVCRTMAVCLVLLSAHGLVHAQRDDADSPFAAALSTQVRTVAVAGLPDPHAFDRATVSLTSLFSARSYVAPRNISASFGTSFVGPVGLGERRTFDATNWILGRPIDNFANGFDQFGNPTIGPIDVRSEARNYVRQRIVSEILSRTALGRGLGLFVDTGKIEPPDGRSRFLPYVSPKVNAREGKAAITLTWKF